MGWSFAYSKGFGKRELVAEIRSDGFSEGRSLIDSSVIGNHFWGVVQRTDGSRYVWLALMASGGKEGGWGSKTMSEDSGPGALDCPLRLLAIAGPPKADSFAVQWRKDVADFHAHRKAKKNAVAPCLVVTYGGHDYQLMRPVGKRKGWVVRRLSDGAEFRMNERQLAQAALAQTKADEAASASVGGESQLELWEETA